MKAMFSNKKLKIDLDSSEFTNCMNKEKKVTFVSSAKVPLSFKEAGLFFI